MLKKKKFCPENLEKKNFFGAEKSAFLENTIKYDLFLHRCRFFAHFFFFLHRVCQSETKRSELGDGADRICTVISVKKLF